MPRIRYLKPDFFSDEDLGRLPYETRLTFAGLWCYADKEGRLEDRPMYLKAMIFPYDNIDMNQQLETLSHAKANGHTQFIERYHSGNANFIQICNWKKHQRPHFTEKNSRINPPSQNVEIPPHPPTEYGKGNGKPIGTEKLVSITEKERSLNSEINVAENLDNTSLTVNEQIKPKTHSLSSQSQNQNHPPANASKEELLAFYQNQTPTRKPKTVPPQEIPSDLENQSESYKSHIKNIQSNLGKKIPQPKPKPKEPNLESISDAEWIETFKPDFPLINVESIFNELKTKGRDRNHILKMLSIHQREAKKKENPND